MKVMTVFGTRPEAIKMAPIVNELKQRKHIESVVCTTGQHKEMLKSVLDIFNIIPDYELNIMKENQDLFDITQGILSEIKKVLLEVNPNVVLVHGDTSTTYVTALACFYLGIPIAHVEAGLRTGNIKSPFPEEFNRRSVTLISDIHFAPTNDSKNNLLKEKVNESQIIITGNTAIDALKTTIKKDYSHPLFEWIEESRLIMLTAHRRENIGEPMENMFKAINRILNEFPDVKCIYPIHMNPKVRDTANRIFTDDTRVKLVEPMNVVDFHNFLNKSYLILTDSGGIQEEAPSLGKPVLVMRDTTERPEGIEAGTLKLVGVEEENIYNQFKLLLENQSEYKKMSTASNPYGDGNASQRIIDALEEKFHK